MHICWFDFWMIYLWIECQFYMWNENLGVHFSHVQEYGLSCSNLIDIWGYCYTDKTKFSMKFAKGLTYLNWNFSFRYTYNSRLLFFSINVASISLQSKMLLRLVGAICHTAEHVTLEIHRGGRLSRVIIIREKRLLSEKSYQFLDIVTSGSFECL